MRRRIGLLGAVVAVSAMGVPPATSGAASKHKPRHPALITSKAQCKTQVAVMVAAGDSGVTPPVQSGREFGDSTCGKTLGEGVQRDSFTVDDAGDTQSTFSWFFRTGTLHGSYSLAPQEGSLNFLNVDYVGTMTVSGGTGTLKGTFGTGAMACTSADGIHTTCTTHLKLKKAA